jgi:hypothetical protein
MIYNLGAGEKELREANRKSNELQGQLEARPEIATQDATKTGSTGSVLQ